MLTDLQTLSLLLNVVNKESNNDIIRPGSWLNFWGLDSGLERIYHVLTRTMENELPAGVNSVLNYAASPGVILPIFMLLG